MTFMLMSTQPLYQPKVCIFHSTIKGYCYYPFWVHNTWVSGIAYRLHFFYPLVNSNSRTQNNVGGLRIVGETKRKHEMEVSVHAFVSAFVLLQKWACPFWFDLSRCKWHSQRAEWHTEKMLMPKSVITIFVCFTLSPSYFAVCMVHIWKRSFIYSLWNTFERGTHFFFVQYAFILYSIEAFSIIYKKRMYSSIVWRSG